MEEDDPVQYRGGVAVVGEQLITEGNGLAKASGRAVRALKRRAAQWAICGWPTAATAPGWRQNHRKRYRR